MSSSRRRTTWTGPSGRWTALISAAGLASPPSEWRRTSSGLRRQGAVAVEAAIGRGRRREGGTAHTAQGARGHHRQGGMTAGRLGARGHRPRGGRIRGLPLRNVPARAARDLPGTNLTEHDLCMTNLETREDIQRRQSWKTQKRSTVPPFTRMTSPTTSRASR